MKWQTAWLLIRDVLVTGTGLVIIVTQVFSRQPSDVLLVTAIALTTPSLAAHAGTLLGGQSSTGAHGPSPSPSSSSPPGSSPSSPEPDGPGEQALR